MHSLSCKNLTLDERMDRIEQQNLRLRRYLLVSVLTLLAILVMGAKAGLNNGNFGKVTAERIAIVDSTGKEVLLIGTDKNGTGIRILNNEGVRVLGIGTTDDDRGSGLLIADNKGRPRFGLGIDNGLPSFAMVNEDGKKIMAMGGNRKGYGLVIMDDNEVERAGIGFKDGDTGIMIYNDKGEYARGLIRLANGDNYSSYIDDKGEEVRVK